MNINDLELEVNGIPLICQTDNPENFPKLLTNEIDIVLEPGLLN